MPGTSRSWPAVAGAAGLAFSANPALTGAQMRQLLDATARDVGAAGRDPAFGYGIVDMAALVSAARGAPAPNSPPTASFSWSATDLTASVDASASRDPDGSIVSSSCTWGDGPTGGTTYTLCVTQVSESGWAYDAASNFESCQGLVV